MSESAHELTTAIAAGDTEAFSRFYRRWFDFAFAQARRASGRDEQFCLDMVQEAMMRVIRSIKPMHSETDVERWLRVVVQSCCFDQFRSENRRRRRERDIASGEQQPIAGGESDRMKWLRQQLENLDAEQVKLLTLRFRFGWTLKRIGTALGLKPGAVDGRLSRSLAALRTQAQEDCHEPD